MLLQPYPKAYLSTHQLKFVVVAVVRLGHIDDFLSGGRLGGETDKRLVSYHQLIRLLVTQGKTHDHFLLVVSFKGISSLK